MPKQPRGMTTRPAPPAPRQSQVIEGLFVACPMCSMSRKLEKTGAWARVRHRLDTSKDVKGRSHFGTFNLGDSYVIQVRDCSGSRGHGFPILNGYTLEQLKAMPEFSDVLQELRDACAKILAALE